jgi:hypothetical protein
MNKTLIEQIEEIDEQIRVLKNKRSTLSDRLSENGSFKERLQAWQDDTRKVNVRYFMSGYKLPNLVNYCTDREIGRSETIFIGRCFEYEIGRILDEEDDNVWQNKDSEFYVSPRKIKCLEEAINENMDSFTFDY